MQQMKNTYMTIKGKQK